MTSVWSHAYLCKDQTSVTLSTLLIAISKALSLIYHEINELKIFSIPKKLIFTLNLTPSSVPELPATSSTTKYLKDDLKYIFKIVLET